MLLDQSAEDQEADVEQVSKLFLEYLVDEVEHGTGVDDAQTLERSLTALAEDVAEVVYEVKDGGRSNRSSLLTLSPPHISSTSCFLLTLLPFCTFQPSPDKIYEFTIIKHDALNQRILDV